MSRAALIAALLACGPNARDRCFDAAELAAEARVDRECPEAFVDCAAAPAIVADLERELERCPP
jgi:hypothetical protein